MTGNCADCWHRIRVAVGSYTSPDVADRCWHWERLGEKLMAAGECDSWHPMSEDEEARRIAYFLQSFKEWRAYQRAALEVLLAGRSGSDG